MGGTMPVWGAVTLAVAVALITQIGTLLVTQRQHRHERKISQIEEWHRNLRWAVELVAKGYPALGVPALDALDDAKFVEIEDQNLIDSVLQEISNAFVADIEPSPHYTGEDNVDGGDFQ